MTHTEWDVYPLTVPVVWVKSQPQASLEREANVEQDTSVPATSDLVNTE